MRWHRNRHPSLPEPPKTPARGRLYFFNGLLEVHRFTGGPLGENGYLIRCTATDQAAVVDPGASAPAMVEMLEDKGWSLQAIYLTHAHFDHVEGVLAIRRLGDAPIYLHPSDRAMYDHAEERATLFGLDLEGPLPPPDQPMVPGESVPVGERQLEVRFTPGHAEGHVILYSPDAGFALVGDVIFKGSIGRTDLPGGDFQELMASIRGEVLTLPDETVLFPGHGEETTVRHERLGNPFLISQVPGRFA